MRLGILRRPQGRSLPHRQPTTDGLVQHAVQERQVAALLVGLLPARAAVVPLQSEQHAAVAVPRRPAVRV